MMVFETALKRQSGKSAKNSVCVPTTKPRGPIRKSCHLRFLNRHRKKGNRNVCGYAGSSYSKTAE
jgi:hypothetical protein